MAMANDVRTMLLRLLRWVQVRRSAKAEGPAPRCAIARRGIPRFPVRSLDRPGTIGYDSRMSSSRRPSPCSIFFTGQRLRCHWHRLGKPRALNKLALNSNARLCYRAEIL